MAIKMPSQKEMDDATRRIENEGQIDRYLQLIEAGHGNFGIWYNLGVAYANKQLFEKAEDAYHKCLEENPEVPQAWVNLAFLYFRKEEFDKAIEYNKKALEIKPDFIHALSNLGMVQLRAGYFEDAVETMLKTIEIEPKHPVALAAITQAYNSLGDEKNGKKYQKLAEEAGVIFKD